MAPAPKPKPKPGGRIAGLPWWAWLAAAGVGLVVGFVFLRRPGAQSSPAPGPLVTPAPPDGAFAGSPGENAAPADSLSPDVLAALGDLGAELAGLRSDIAYAQSSSFGDGGGRIQEGGYDAAPAPVQAAAAGIATAVATTAPPRTTTIQPASGVLWGGQVFTTRKALAGWLSARGADYQTWARNHPAAAAKLK